MRKPEKLWKDEFDNVSSHSKIFYYHQTTAVQTERGDNYCNWCLLNITVNYLMIVTQLMTFFLFYLSLNAKGKPIVLTNMKTMNFCLQFIQDLFTKIFEATALFRNYIYWISIYEDFLNVAFFQRNVNPKQNKLIISRRKIILNF